MCSENSEVAKLTHKKLLLEQYTVKARQIRIFGSVSMLRRIVKDVVLCSRRGEGVTYRTCRTVKSMTKKPIATATSTTTEVMASKNQQQTTTLTKLTAMTPHQRRRICSRMGPPLTLQDYEASEQNQNLSETPSCTCRRHDICAQCEKEYDGWVIIAKDAFGIDVCKHMLLR